MQIMPTVLSPCCSLDPDMQDMMLWALNSPDGAVILSAVEVQGFFDKLYNITHDFDYRNCVREN
jgi:hypothetical protein